MLQVLSCKMKDQKVLFGASRTEKDFLVFHFGMKSVDLCEPSALTDIMAYIRIVIKMYDNECHLTCRI